MTPSGGYVKANLLDLGLYSTMKEESFLFNGTV